MIIKLAATGKESFLGMFSFFSLSPSSFAFHSIHKNNNSTLLSSSKIQIQMFHECGTNSRRKRFGPKVLTWSRGSAPDQLLSPEPHWTIRLSTRLTSSELYLHQIIHPGRFLHVSSTRRPLTVGQQQGIELKRDVRSSRVRHQHGKCLKGPRLKLNLLHDTFTGSVQRGRRWSPSSEKQVGMMTSSALPTNNHLCNYWTEMPEATLITKAE